MTKLTSLCVYCGASTGNEPVFVDAATRLGRAMADAGIELIYGGGSVGMMGAVADATLRAGGRAVGIIPGFLHAREVMHQDLTELIVTDDMHQRKRLMFERADAFVALPGGIGTLEELVEQLTWAQLGRHKKPIALANINGFWDPLIDLISHMREMDFIRPDLDIQYVKVDEIENVLPRLQERIEPVAREDLAIAAASADRL